jgi:hypothetical protein
MTTTSAAPPAQSGQAGSPAAPSIAALIAEAPTPQPTLVKTFAAMMARNSGCCGETRSRRSSAR